MTPSDKKFLTILGVITLLIAGGLIYWGMRGGSRYKEAADNYDMAADGVRRLEGLKPYPSSPNVNAKTTALKEYQGSLVTVQEGFIKYRPPELKNVSSADFSARVLEVSGVAKQQLEEAQAEFPENFALGFEKYTTDPARQDATGLLGYQLDGIGELFRMLAESRPGVVVNFMREPLPEETAGDYKRGGSEVARALSVEVTFSGQERAFRDFLNLVVNSEKYYFVIRNLRIANERQTGPTAEEAKFQESKPAVVNPFEGSGFDLPGLEEAPAGGTVPPAGGAVPPDGAIPAPAPGEAVVEPIPAPAPAPAPAVDDESNLILKQLIGSEEINVFMRIDLMLFHGDVELPQP